ncbi:hypothetical protein EON67_12035, partial [archaeon]
MASRPLLAALHMPTAGGGLEFMVGGGTCPPASGGLRAGSCGDCSILTAAGAHTPITRMPATRTRQLVWRTAQVRTRCHRRHAPLPRTLMVGPELALYRA